MVKIDKFEFVVKKTSYRTDNILKLFIQMSEDEMRNFPNYCKEKRMQINSFDGPTNGFYRVGFELNISEKEKPNVENLLNNLDNSTLPLMLDNDEMKTLNFLCGILIKFKNND